MADIKRLIRSSDIVARLPPFRTTSRKIPEDAVWRMRKVSRDLHNVSACAVLVKAVLTGQPACNTTIPKFDFETGVYRTSQDACD
jgi:hypothetical protein